MTQVQEILYRYQDKKYGDFIAKLVPVLPREAFIGVRRPSYNKVIKEFQKLTEKEQQDFLKSLPHKYHEENKLHACLINQMKNYEQCEAELENFLPFITNWDVSDGIRPAVLGKNKDKLIKKLPLWLQDSKPYTIRVGLLLLMKFFLDEDFKPEYLEWVSEIRSDEYYVNMMIAWFFAEALVKQWDAAIPFIQNKRLSKWTHRKTIQKARESFRISDEKKEYLKSLKIK